MLDHSGAQVQSTARKGPHVCKTALESVFAVKAHRPDVKFVSCVQALPHPFKSTALPSIYTRISPSGPTTPHSEARTSLTYHRVLVPARNTLTGGRRVGTPS